MKNDVVVVNDLVGLLIQEESTYSTRICLPFNAFQPFLQHSIPTTKLIISTCCSTFQQQIKSHPPITVGMVRLLHTIILIHVVVKLNVKCVANWLMIQLIVNICLTKQISLLNVPICRTNIDKSTFLNKIVYRLFSILHGTLTLVTLIMPHCTSKNSMLLKITMKTTNVKLGTILICLFLMLVHVLCLILSFLPC